VGWPWDFSFGNELSLFHYHTRLYCQLSTLIILFSEMLKFFCFIFFKEFFV
jgi:hypothetical protein